MCALKSDQERVRNILHNTVVSLCENGLSYQKHLRIEGVIGITKDGQDVFIVHINQLLTPQNDFTHSQLKASVTSPNGAGRGTKRATGSRCANTIRFMSQTCRQSQKQKPTQKKAFQHHQEQPTFQSAAVNSRLSRPPLEFSPRASSNALHAMRSPLMRPTGSLVQRQVISPMSRAARPPPMMTPRKSLSASRASSQPMMPWSTPRQLTWNSIPSMPFLDRYSPEKTTTKSSTHLSPSAGQFVALCSPTSICKSIPDIPRRKHEAAGKGESYLQEHINNCNHMPLCLEGNVGPVKMDKSCEVILVDDEDVGSPTLPSNNSPPSDSPHRYHDKDKLADAKLFLPSELDRRFVAQDEAFAEPIIPSGTASQSVNALQDESPEGIALLPEDSVYSVMKVDGDECCSPSFTLMETTMVKRVASLKQISPVTCIEVNEVDEALSHLDKNPPDEAVLLGDSLDETFEAANNTFLHTTKSIILEDGPSNELLSAEKDEVLKSAMSTCKIISSFYETDLQYDSVDHELSTNGLEYQNDEDQQHLKMALMAESSQSDFSSVIPFSPDQYVDEENDCHSFKDTSDEDWQIEDDNEALSDPDWSEDEPQKKRSKTAPKKCNASSDSGSQKQKVSLCFIILNVGSQLCNILKKMLLNIILECGYCRLFH